MRLWSNKGAAEHKSSRLHFNPVICLRRINLSLARKLKRRSKTVLIGTALSSILNMVIVRSDVCAARAMMEGCGAARKIKLDKLSLDQPAISLIPLPSLRLPKRIGLRSNIRLSGALVKSSSITLSDVSTYLQLLSQLSRQNEIHNQKFHTWRKRSALDIVYYRLWLARQKSV
jgi:hypothetical protein